MSSVWDWFAVLLFGVCPVVGIFILIGCAIATWWKRREISNLYDNPESDHAN